MMSEAQVLHALSEADSILAAYPVERYSAEGALLPFLGKPQAAAHCRWMVAECRVMLADGRREKVMRWLGFVQGTMWAMGVVSIGALKDHNRPAEIEAPV